MVVNKKESTLPAQFEEVGGGAGACLIGCVGLCVVTGFTANAAGTMVYFAATF